MNFIKITLLALMLTLTISFEIPFGFSWKDLLKYSLEYGSNFLPNVGKTSYPYFNVFPTYLTHLQPNEPFQFSSKCFTHVEVMVEEREDYYQIIVKNAKPVDIFCTDTLFFGSWEEYQLIELTTLWWSPTFVMKKTWDTEYKGIGLFDFRNSLLGIIENFTRTAEIFGGMLYKQVPENFKQANIDFMQKYSGVEFKKRKTQNVDIDVSQIRSGDTFHIRRFSTSGPIGWAMGSAIGHMTMAIKRNGIMMVCEAQSSGDYWEDNGIQCKKYEDWVKIAREAEYQFVWAPLDRSIEFDEEAANKFIDKYYGVDYGYEVLLTGWLDLKKDNFPCRRGENFPIDQWGICLEAEFVEYLSTAIERKSKDAARIWSQAMGNRVQMNDGSPLYQVYRKAAENNISSLDLFTIPEDDKWVYKTFQNGKPVETQMFICHEFVCQAMRAAGVFKKFGNPDFNCNESTLFDMYKLRIFEKDFERPQQCVDADPENPLCQLGGEFELRLDTFRKNQQNYNFVDLTPNNFEKCPSEGPDYISDPHC